MILTFDNFINFSSEVWQKPAFFKTFESKAFDLVHFHRTISYHTIDLYNQGERAFLDAITETSQRHISPKIQLLPLSPTPCYMKKPIWTCNQANLISKLGDGTFGKEGEITKLIRPVKTQCNAKVEMIIKSYFWWHLHVRYFESWLVLDVYPPPKLPKHIVPHSNFPQNSFGRKPYKPWGDDLVNKVSQKWLDALRGSSPARQINCTTPCNLCNTMQYHNK